MTGLTTGAALVALACSAAAAQAPHVVVDPRSIAWTAAPPMLPPGAQSAVLYGDPTRPGLFVMRLRAPKGYRLPPHTHPRPEIVTIISGALHLGMGTTASPAKARRLGPGSFSAMAADMPHFAFTREETVIQISTTGPWGLTYVDPADDPRNASRRR